MSKTPVAAPPQQQPQAPTATKPATVQRSSLSTEAQESSYDRSDPWASQRTAGFGGEAPLRPLSNQGSAWRRTWQHATETSKTSEPKMVHSFADVKVVQPKEADSALHSNRGGKVMPEDVQAKMETAFGTDFSGVRIHEGPRATDLGALAYTQGTDIHFAPGQYDPGSQRGQKLLGHELAHVVQQSQGRVQATTQAKGVRVNDDATLEREADEMGAKAAQGERVTSHELAHGVQWQEGSLPAATNDTVIEPSHALQSKADALARQASSGSIAHPTAEISPRSAQRSIVSLPPSGSAALIQRKPTDNPPLTSRYFKDRPFFQKMNADDSVLLRKGDSGEHVAHLQRALLKLDYSLPEYGADGNFGDETATALRYFQIESGLVGDQVDGILGPQTLHLMDMRFATRSMSHVVDDKGGSPKNSTHRVYEVPVPPDLLKERSKEEVKQKFLLLTLMHIFRISRPEAEVLVGDNGWRWKTYHGITETDVEVGFNRVKISKVYLESLKSKASDKLENTVGGVNIETEAVSQSLDLQGTGRLRALNQAIDEVEQQIENLVSLKQEIKALERSEKYKQPVSFLQPEISALEEKRSALLSQRDAELERLGMTLKDYEDKVTGFKATFARFAVTVALDMLDANETSANVERSRYENKHPVAEVQEILRGLNDLYNRADQAWWQGLSYELTNDADKIENDADLAAEASRGYSMSQFDFDVLRAVKLKANYQKVTVQGGR